MMAGGGLVLAMKPGDRLTMGAITAVCVSSGTGKLRLAIDAPRDIAIRLEPKAKAAMEDSSPAQR
jgi:sRNA-binding carbon storage regulator CsrA